MTPGIIILGLIVLVAVYAVSIYNALQQLKTQIQASIQEIGNQLKRQASLIPNLEAAVKGSLKHEKEIFKSLTDARKAVASAQDSSSPEAAEAAIAKVRSVIPQLNVAIEDNPELKANESIMRFMQELGDTADKLSYARRSVIDLSASYNMKLVTFPSNLIANAFGFKPEAGLKVATEGKHLEVSEAETEDPKVSL